MTKVVMIFSIYCLAAPAAAESLARHERDYAKKPKKPVQDGIHLNVLRSEPHELHSAPYEAAPDTPFEVVKPHHPQAASLLETGRICEDVNPEHTGFDVHGDDGFMKHASCEDLAQYCHNATIGEQVRVSCPVSCFICTSGGTPGEDTNGPCFDASNTGIRFRDGPKAQCGDLINYCNQSSISTQVREACRLSCGQCEIHVEGPYLDPYGNCVDLMTHEEPVFTKAGALAGCADMAEFCANHPDSYLIRHKCPLTCGVCGQHPSTTEKPLEETVEADVAGCDRRRRWGFCSTRRRRHI